MFVVETSWAYSIYPGVETPGYMLKALSGLFKKKCPMQRALPLPGEGWGEVYRTANCHKRHHEE